MKRHKRGASQKIKIRHVHKDHLDGDVIVMLCLSVFYGLEMSKTLGWTVEHRYGQMTQMQIMIRAGHSKMLIALAPDGMPMGMLITTKTDKPKIRRMEAILVFEPFRGQGIAQALLAEAKGGGELHSYAAPSAVEWHLKNGFRSLGAKEDDGTIEMFTGNYKPVYGFNFVVPLKTEYDAAAIRNLEQMERSLLGERR